jgi:opacity protein-like surface antigen
MLVFVPAASLALASAQAQQLPWTGWSLGLNLSRATTATEFGGAGTTSSMGAADVHATVQAAYGLPLVGRARLGLGLALGLGELQAGRQTLAGSELSFRMRERYALYAEPGLTLGDATLLYGKLAYLGARGEESYQGETFSKTYAGLGYGAGLRTALGARLYLQLELLHSDYEWKTARTGAFRPVSTTGSIGLGYRF